MNGKPKHAQSNPKVPTPSSSTCTMIAWRTARLKTRVLFPGCSIQGLYTNSYVCMCVCIYICMYVCMYACAYAHACNMFTHIYIYVMCICRHELGHVCVVWLAFSLACLLPSLLAIYACIACMHAWTEGGMDGCMHACIHVCTYVGWCMHVCFEGKCGQSANLFSRLRSRRR